MVLSNGHSRLAEALSDDFEDGAIEGSRNFLVEFADSKAWNYLDLTRIGFNFAV